MAPNGIAAAIPTQRELPTWTDEVHRFAKSEAFLKMEEYRRRIFSLEREHGMTLAAFRRMAKKGQENFSVWDALIAWEGVADAYDAWRKRYHALH